MEASELDTVLQKATSIIPNHTIYSAQAPSTVLSGLHPIAEAIVMVIISTTDTTTPRFPAQAAKLTPTSQEICVSPVLQVLHLQRTQQAAVVEQVSPGLVGTVHSVLKPPTVAQDPRLVTSVLQHQLHPVGRKDATVERDVTGRKGAVHTAQLTPTAGRGTQPALLAQHTQHLQQGRKSVIVRREGTGIMGIVPYVRQIPIALKGQNSAPPVLQDQLPIPDQKGAIVRLENFGQIRAVEHVQRTPTVLKDQYLASLVQQTQLPFQNRRYVTALQGFSWSQESAKLVQKTTTVQSAAPSALSAHLTVTLQQGQRSANVLPANISI